jgi:hypothetical protein
MKKRTMLGVCLAAVLGVTFATQPAAAQMVDTVRVTLPYAATLGNVTLPAGDYTIRNVEDNGNSAVLRIYSNKGVSVSALVMQVDAPNHRTPQHTSVVLRHEGDSYQVDRIFLEGQDIGYEFLSAAE